MPSMTWSGPNRSIKSLIASKVSKVKEDFESEYDYMNQVFDDTDAENSCMRFIPRSHVHGTLMHTPSVAAEDIVPTAVRYAGP